MHFAKSAIKRIAYGGHDDTVRFNVVYPLPPAEVVAEVAPCDPRCRGGGEGGRVSRPAAHRKNYGKGSKEERPEKLG